MHRIWLASQNAATENINLIELKAIIRRTKISNKLYTYKLSPILYKNCQYNYVVPYNISGLSRKPNQSRLVQVKVLLNQV